VGDRLADICIIYAHPSKSVVAKLHALLSERYDVWWDERIHSGPYREKIERQLAQAKCVIPVWCRVSRADPDVIDEAKFSERRTIPLLPVRIEDVEAPLGFGPLQTIDLLGWKGELDHLGVQALMRNIQKVIDAPPPLLLRPNELVVNDHSVASPVFFRSVSSHETPIPPEEAVRALTLFGPDTLLVSAYDMVHQEHADRIVRDLESYRSAGGIVLLDSGNYEAYRKGDYEWNPDLLREAIEVTPYDEAFCFDQLEPPSEIDEAVRAVVSAVERDSAHGRRPVLPIVHAPLNGATRAAKIDLVPELMKRVARELRPALLAIPERELGPGLMERARNVYQIRKQMDTLGFYQPLHLLGTGNPLSIAVFTAVGADSFDGLEWCRTVVDHDKARLYHFQQYDFFAWQSEQYAVSPIVREAVRNDKVGFSGKVVFHNLEFFASWMKELREHLSAGKLDRFLSDKLPGGTRGMKLLETAVPEVFA
jgi:queuine/archaeosine tRNA-ribosyltransferase